MSKIALPNSDREVGGWIICQCKSNEVTFFHQHYSGATIGEHSTKDGKCPTCEEKIPKSIKMLGLLQRIGNGST